MSGKSKVKQQAKQQDKQAAPEQAEAAAPAQAEISKETAEAAGAPGGMEAFQAALAKLPLLGPAMWLYARDPMKRFTFIGDIDWQILPPLTINQCGLYTRNKIPFAFFTWAQVSDAIDSRLRSGMLRIAPQEWNSGPHIWLVDIVAPFGKADEILAEVGKAQFAGKKVSALVPDPQQGNQLKLREWTF